MTDRTVATKPAGAALIVAAVGTVLAMSHHPSGMHSGALSGSVHGAMIGLLLIMTWGFLQFSLIRDITRPLVGAGMLALGISLFSHIGAATINGFVVPALAERGPDAAGHDLFLFSWEMNQALAKLGTIMTGLAFIAWGIDLLRDQAKSAKLIGALGIAAGGVPAALLLFGAIGRMDVTAAFMTYSVHGAWSALVGVALLRGHLIRQEAA